MKTAWGLPEDAKFTEIRFFPERLEGKIPEKAFIFLGSMSDPEFWPMKVVQEILPVIKQNPTTLFLMLSHNYRTWLTKKFPQGNDKPKNARYGVSVTHENALQFIEHAREGLIDFASFEPFLLDGISREKVEEIQTLPEDFVFIFGGKTPVNKKYIEKYAESLDWITQELYEEGSHRVCVKRNAYRLIYNCSLREIDFLNNKILRKEFNEFKNEFLRYLWYGEDLVWEGLRIGKNGKDVVNCIFRGKTYEYAGMTVWDCSLLKKKNYVYANLLSCKNCREQISCSRCKTKFPARDLIKESDSFLCVGCANKKGGKEKGQQKLEDWMKK
jgi:hypothetical protein